MYSSAHIHSNAQTIEYTYTQTDLCLSVCIYVCMSVHTDEQ